MHHLVELYLSWFGTLYLWARNAVEILLWFWVVSGAIVALRFLMFMLTDRSIGSSVLATEFTPLEGPTLKGVGNLRTKQQHPAKVKAA